MAITLEQLAWLLKVQSKGGLWDSVHPRKGRGEAAAGRWFLLDFTLENLWVGSETEHINNILGNKKKPQSRKCETRLGVA